MKALMFVYNPFTNDPRVYNEAKSLIKAGHQVTVIAFDRDKQNPQIETWDGIQVIRLRTRLAPIHGFGWPLWNTLIMLLWQCQAYNKAMALHKQSGLHIIHCHDFDTLLAGVWLKRKLGLPLIYDAHEIYWYTITRALPRWVATMFSWLEKRLVAKVDIIITVSEVLKSYFNGITDKPISVIMNCKPLESLQYQPPDNKDKFTMLYIGALHPGRSILMIINTAEKLPDIHCTIGGIGQQDYVRHIKESCDRIPNIDFVGKVPFDEVLPMTKKADVVFCMFDPTDSNSNIGTPNKLFEAMVCGRPIICTKGTYSGDLAEREQVGLAVEHSDETLKQAIIRLRDTPGLRERLGRNALKTAKTKYNWQKEEQKLLKLYRHIGAHQS
ncbi:MAG: glycosyltransferase family 4 protein [Dehalococcoidia bacterium]|nr:glycosyltransferase family 4 protein [Dehalococcoidia bacterium]